MIDDGIVIDLAGMKGIRVDPVNRVARAEAGLTWGEFDRETQVFGFAATGGEISSTGIAGLTLGGGIGISSGSMASRATTCFRPTSWTADGRTLTAREAENPDLFWGLRGGGGNSGIVTSFEYRLHPVGQVLGGPVIHTFDAARELCNFYRDYSSSAPDEVAALFAIQALPDGQWAAAVFVCSCEPPESAETAIASVRAFGSPMEDLIQAMSYRDVQQAFDADFPTGLNHYCKSSNVATLSDDAIDTMIAFAKQAPSPRPMVFLERFGGAVARVPDEATAFGHRDAAWDLVIAAIWRNDDEAEAHIDWARSFWDAMQPYSTESVYVNYLSDEGHERVRAAYGESNTHA